MQDDVKATAEDLARASRHERRLEKAIVSVALQQAADDVQNVAEDEAEHAKLQLQTAEAKAADPKAEELSGDAKPAIAANAAVAKSEAALTAQAEALEPQTSDASAEGSDGSDAASGESGQQQQQQFTSEEMAQGQQLAQALDELDRQAGAEGLDSGESSGTVPSLAKAAALQQAKPPMSPLPPSMSVS